jgi:hypothetical protein
VHDRITFWAALHERLAKLHNRITPEEQARVLGLVHERISCAAARKSGSPTPDRANVLPRVKIWVRRALEKKEDARIAAVFD